MSISSAVIEAIEAISSHNASLVKFDTTIVCSVISYDEATKLYRVSDGTSNFSVTAQDETKTYAEGINVNVLIPNGDLSSSGKTILGKYETSAAISYEDLVAEFDFTPSIYLSQQQNTSSQTYSVGTLTSNINKKILTNKFNINQSVKENWYKSTLNQVDTLAFTFELITKDFPIDYNQENKEYGIYVEIDYEGLSDPIILSVHDTDFIGNKFALELEGAQQRFLFDCQYDDKKGKIQHLDIDKIQGYQFYFICNKLSEGSIEEEAAKASITIKNCKLVAGYRRATAFTQDDCSININEWTKSSELTFDKSTNLWQYISSETELKDQVLQLQFFYNGEVYNQQTTTDVEPLTNYKVYWCKYTDNYVKSKADDIVETGEGWETLAVKKATESAAYTFTIPAINRKLLSNKFKVVIVDEKGKVFKTSNVLSIEKKNGTSSALITEEKGLLLDLIGTTGMFYDYNQTTQARTSSNASAEFEIMARYKDGVDWTTQEQTITWSIPAELSMLEPGADWVEQDGYYTYTKTSKNSSDCSIKLKRKNKYNALYTKNKISCSVKRGTEIKTGGIQLQFGLSGTTGTTWSCNIVADKPYACLTEKDMPFQVRVLVLNDKGEDYTEHVQDSDITWTWMVDGLSDDEKTAVQEQNNKLFYIVKNKVEMRKENKITGNNISIRPFPSDGANNPTNFIQNGNFAILRAEVKINKTTLIDYWPIPLAHSKIFAGFDGICEIIYNNQGTQPQPSSMEYSLRRGSDSSVRQKTKMYYVFYGGSEPTIDTGTKKGMFASKEGSKYLLHNQVVEKKNVPGVFTLTPPSSFNAQIASIVVVSTEKEGDIEAGTVLWAQPLYYQKNYYGIKKIQDWDGSAQIDSKGNYIGAPIFISGTYNATRQFSGLLMGTSTGQGDGLFGYANGSNTFGLKTSGAFYFGNDVSGKITFTPGETSSSLSIKVKKFDLEALTDKGAGLKIDSDNTNVLQVFGETNKKTVNISKDGSFMFGEEGGKISFSADSDSFEIEAKKFKLQAKNNSGKGFLLDSNDTNNEILQLFNANGARTMYLNNNGSFSFGRTDGNGKISFDATADEFIIDVKKFNLDAIDNSNTGLSINSRPTKNTDYVFCFKKANADIIRFNKNGTAKIGGWNIEGNYLWCQNSNGKITGMQAGGTVAFVAGAENNNDWTKAPVSIHHDGTFQFGKETSQISFDGNKLRVTGEISQTYQVTERNNNYKYNNLLTGGLSNNFSYYPQGHDLYMEKIHSASNNGFNQNLHGSNFNQKTHYLSGLILTGNSNFNEGDLYDRPGNLMLGTFIAKKDTSKTQKTDFNGTGIISNSNCLLIQNIGSDKNFLYQQAGVANNRWASLIIENYKLNELQNSAIREKKGENTKIKTTQGLYFSHQHYSDNTGGASIERCISQIDLIAGVHLGYHAGLSIRTEGGYTLYMGETSVATEGNAYVYQFGNWTTNSPGGTNSDKNLKNNIESLSEKYSVFFDHLKPVTFKYNDGTSGRNHIGFISQEVQEALDKALIDSKDFAGVVILNRGTKDETWTLRYDEFIALNTYEIQKLKARVAELEAMVKKE